MPAHEYSIFVNTCDDYRDCWDPFFQLFEKYWPEPKPRIYLNTERLDYAYRGLDIVATRAARDAGCLPWGTLLRRGLSDVPDEIILYFHEDYFLCGPVETNIVTEFSRIIRAQPDITAIRLQELGGAGPWSPCEHEMLWEVDRRSPYRISLQAGLWRTARLGALVRAHENPWQFEVWGSRRMRRQRDRILCVNRDMFAPGLRQILPYPASDSLKKGKWNRDVVVDLFRKNGIELDFSSRGFFDPSEKGEKRPLVRRLLSRLRSL